MALDASELTRKHQGGAYYTLKGSSVSQLHYVRSGLNVNSISQKKKSSGDMLTMDNRFWETLYLERVKHT